MSNRKEAARWYAAVFGLAMSTAGLALAQVAPVNQGHALDANPQVGSGGGNGAAAGGAYQPVNGNDIFTGNVTGLGYFHGSVPYSSLYQFHSNLPSASLSSFTRASTGGYNPPTNVGLMRTYYTTSTLVSTNNGRVNAGVATNATGNHLESALTGAGSINPNTAAGAANASRVGVSSVSFSQAPNFQDFQKVSSQRVVPSVDDSENDTLFGLRRSLETAPVNAQTLAPETPTNEDNSAPGALSNPNMPGPAGPGAKPAADQPIDDAVNPDEKPKGLGERELVVDRIRDKPIRNALTTPRLSRTPGEFPDAIGKFEPIHVSAPFEDQLASLQYNPKAQTPTELAGGTNASGVPDNTRFATVATKKNTTDTKKPVRPHLTVTSVGSDQPSAPEREPGSANASATQPSSVALAPTGADSAISAADYIARAAGLLKDGQYLQAADTYQSALRAEPANSVALIGRAHAELAAGLYESAKFDFQYFFNVQPQRMADRYNLVALISGRRVDFLEKDLLALQQKSIHTPAEFLLSYLYFQTGRQDDLKAALDRWSKLLPDDPWPAELQKVWLAEKTPATQPGG